MKKKVKKIQNINVEINLKVEKFLHDLKNIKTIKIGEKNCFRKKSSISMEDNISTIESSKSTCLEKVTEKSKKKNRNFMEIKKSFGSIKQNELEVNTGSNSFSGKKNMDKMLKTNKNAILTENKLTELYEELKENYNEYINKKKIKMLQIANNNLINCKKEIKHKKYFKIKQGKILY